MPVPYADLQLQYQTIKSEIDAAIAAVIRDNAFIRGPYVDAFEREFSAAVDIEHCVSCANGTDALYLAMAALKVQPPPPIRSIPARISARWATPARWSPMTGRWPST
jgi:dTDP-4-amino-4,6-dideoxygalactose transaminase